MYHNFTPSQANDKLCATCKHDLSNHVCEICSKEALVDIHWSMLLCKDCYEKELAAQKEIRDTADERVKAISQPDTTIKVSQDIFNAKIASIEDLRKAIDADATIENKAFALASVLNERYIHLKNVLIPERQALVNDGLTEERAIQSYYNDLSKKLREKERAEIKIQDVRYQPPDKPVKTPKAPTVKKYDKNAIRDAALASGLAENLIQMVCLQRNVSPLEAVRLMKEMGL